VIVQIAYRLRRLVETAISGGATDKGDSMFNAQTQRLEVSGLSPWARLEADRAFTAASRARRRAALLARVRRLGRTCGLPVYEDGDRRRPGRAGVAEIPLEAIAGTTEPNRAGQFDPQFRPKPLTRSRWQRVWLAVQQGVTLPPISVVRVGDAYAIRDGHHRVSVAKARGALTITARVG
jgi:hypothetical protein